jgi:hypothetical protein
MNWREYGTNGSWPNLGIFPETARTDYGNSQKPQSKYSISPPRPAIVSSKTEAGYNTQPAPKTSDILLRDLRRQTTVFVKYMYYCYLGIDIFQYNRDVPVRDSNRTLPEEALPLVPSCSVNRLCKTCLLKCYKEIEIRKTFLLHITEGKIAPVLNELSTML